MAMPTSALASAGASLMPSPAMATTRPSRCSFATSASLSAGLTSPWTSSMPSCGRDRSGRGQAVAGGHDDADAQRLERRQRFRRACLDRIGDREQPGQAAIDGEEHDAGAFARAALPPAAASASTATPASFISARVAEQRPPGRRPCRARRCPCPTRSSRACRARGRARAPRDDRLGQRMLAALVEARREAQHLVFAMAGDGDGAVEGGLALGQRAGLVDDQGVDLAQVLDRRGIAEQHALRRRLARRHHDRHRRGQAERAGAGDDEHRDGVDQAVDPARLGTEQAPGDEGQHGDADHRRARTSRRPGRPCAASAPGSAAPARPSARSARARSASRPSRRA